MKQRKHPTRATLATKSNAASKPRKARLSRTASAHGTAVKRRKGDSGLQMLKGAQNSKADGWTFTYDRSKSGHRSGFVIGVTGPQGGISSDPTVALSYMVRRAFKPRRIAPVTITGPDGRVLRTIRFGPNGERIVEKA